MRNNCKYASICNLVTDGLLCASIKMRHYSFVSVLDRLHSSLGLKAISSI
jgi:hypothetical protein